MHMGSAEHTAGHSQVLFCYLHSPQVAGQEKPGMSLTAGLSGNAALARTLLAPLTAGLVHGARAIRNATLVFHERPAVQTCLGRHLSGGLHF